MLSGLRIDFDKIKNILYGVASKDGISADRKAEDYIENCKKLAKYCTVENENIDYAKINMEENQGLIFSSSVFVVLRKQLLLERAFQKGNSISLILTELLHDHLGNCYLFELKEEVLTALFENALKAYKAGIQTYNHKDEEISQLIKSMKHLLVYKEIEYKISCGEILLSDESDEFIHNKLEKLISSIGGIRFLKLIFEKQIAPKYNAVLDRYLICRNKSQLVPQNIKLRIPYNYLIQIAVKFLDKASACLYTEKGIKKDYKNITKLSADYLNVLDLQGYSSFEDLMYNVGDVTYQLSKNIVFENLYIPVQYSPEFIIKLIDALCLPFEKNFANCKEYIKLSKYLLQRKGACLVFDINELHCATNISAEKLKNILSQISHDSKNVNCKFKRFLMPTNYKEKPLVKMADGKYFLFSAHFNGYAFYDLIFKNLSSQNIQDFDNIRGKNFEDMIKSFFKEKNFSYHCGHYNITKARRGECDMIIENDKSIVFFEMKSRALPSTFEIGDDVKTLNILAGGMIKAQKQCLMHIEQLEKKGYLDIYDKASVYRLELQERRTVCVSLSLQEYFFFTNKSFSEKLLESLLSVTFHAEDPARENELSEINARAEELVKIVKRIYARKDAQIHQVFFDTLFRSALQIFTILKVSRTLDEFIDYLTEPIYLFDGSGDVYAQLLYSMRLKNYKSSE